MVRSWDSPRFVNSRGKAGRALGAASLKEGAVARARITVRRLEVSFPCTHKRQHFPCCAGAKEQEIHCSRPPAAVYHTARPWYVSLRTRRSPPYTATSLQRAVCLAPWVYVSAALKATCPISHFLDPVPSIDGAVHVNSAT